MIVTGDRIDVHCFVRVVSNLITLFPFSFYFSKSFLVRFLAILASTSILVCFLRWYKLYIKISFLRSEIDVWWWRKARKGKRRKKREKGEKKKGKDSSNSNSFSRFVYYGMKFFLGCLYISLYDMNNIWVHPLHYFPSVVFLRVSYGVEFHVEV